MEDEYKSELTKKYRTELFATDNIDINELDELISDEDLKTVFGLNNVEMVKLINEKEMDKEQIKKILIVNINLYKLAKKREMSLNGSSFLMPIAGAVGYNVDKLYSELSVGRYDGIRKSR